MFMECTYFGIFKNIYRIWKGSDTHLVHFIILWTCILSLRTPLTVVPNTNHVYMEFDLHGQKVAFILK